jgi:hypothetical protein
LAASRAIESLSASAEGSVLLADGIDTSQASLMTAA